MYELQLHECKQELEKVKADLRETKEKYMILKKEKQAEKPKVDRNITLKIVDSDDSKTKFVGGGYKMAPTAVTVSTNTENINELCVCE